MSPILRVNDILVWRTAFSISDWLKFKGEILSERPYYIIIYQITEWQQYPSISIEPEKKLTSQYTIPSSKLLYAFHYYLYIYYNIILVWLSFHYRRI